MDNNSFQLIDSRRLTGPNLLSDKPGAVIDVTFAKDDRNIVAIWNNYLTHLLENLRIQPSIFIRFNERGASLFFESAIDVLYTATEINEWAWQAALDNVVKGEQADFGSAIAHFSTSLDEEANPSLVELQKAAKKHKIDFLWDNDHVSLGLGRHSKCFNTDNIGELSHIDWQQLKSIPCGIITGTNGKTTSVRLACHIIQTGKMNAGVSCTDWIAVNNEIIDKGDYSGPGGAREVLRDKRVDIAVLETARGGLLRRGLSVSHADCALITNIAEDHLGQFGAQNINDLLETKWIVTQVLHDGGLLILNADDPLLVKKAKQYKLPIAWFSLNPDDELVKSSQESIACTIEDETIILYENGMRNSLLALTDIPITHNGLAKHNSYNAMGVVLFCRQLGLPLSVIKKGLTSFLPENNPGRGNIYQINGATVLLDFAHNPHGMAAFIELAKGIGGNRIALVIGQAGDRSDEDIKAFAKASEAVKLDQVFIKKMENLNRGRLTGEAAQILVDAFLELNVAKEHIELVETELDAVEQSIAWANPGDLVILLIHEKRNQVFQKLAQYCDLSIDN